MRWLALAGLSACVVAAAQDGGGHDVSVALFSTRTVHGVTVMAVGPNAWRAKCAGCPHEAFAGPVHVTEGEVFAGGMLRMKDDASGEERTAAGLWHLQAVGGAVDVVLTLPSERYVAAVLSAEAAAGEGAESLRAMAIVVRTYALNERHYTAQAGHLAADLCDSTECQAMRLGAVPQAVEDAVRATAGETLWFGARRAEVFFSQSCGGVTEDVGAVWPRLAGTPYLRTHADAYCLRRDTAAWHTEVSLKDFAGIAKAEGWRVPGEIVGVRVTQRSASHRVLRVVLTGARGEAEALSASALRFGIGRGLGWNRVRSDAYEVGVRNGALVFDGRGHGHGVGLCQAGATEMAKEGKSAGEILGFYFPGTAVRIGAGIGEWRDARAGVMTIRSTQALSDGKKAELERDWSEAQRRFAPRRPVVPEIVFAPTTEMFRQMTSEPGWALASTRGNRIVLQPETVVARYNRLVLHEMLHVLVESEAGETTPLWLREGLVEVLAGENGGGVMAGEAIDRELRSAGSLAASERAHRAAAAKVKALVERYGLAVVRGWLNAPPPPGV